MRKWIGPLGLMAGLLCVMVAGLACPMARQPEQVVFVAGLRLGTLRTFFYGEGANVRFEIVQRGRALSGTWSLSARAHDPNERIETTGTLTGHSGTDTVLMHLASIDGVYQIDLDLEYYPPDGLTGTWSESGRTGIVSIR